MVRFYRWKAAVEEAMSLKLSHEAETIKIKIKIRGENVQYTPNLHLTNFLGLERGGELPRPGFSEFRIGRTTNDNKGEGGEGGARRFLVDLGGVGEARKVVHSCSALVSSVS